MDYPDNMDRDCIPLCDALNALPGITTFESCCGHGRHSHMIFFTALAVENLRPILRSMCGSSWCMETNWASGGDSIYFMLKGPIGPADLPGGANDLASWITNQSRPTSFRCAC